MTRLIAVVELEPDEPTIGLAHVSGGYEIAPFVPRPLGRPGRPWGRAPFDRRRLRRPDVDRTLGEMGYVAERTWEPGAGGQWSAAVEPTFQLEALAVTATEPVAVTLNVAGLLAGRFQPPPTPAELVAQGATDRLAALGEFVRDLAMFASMWGDEARAAARRLNPQLVVAVNVQTQPWDFPAVSIRGTLPDDGPLAWHLASEATRITPLPEIPEFLR